MGKETREAEKFAGQLDWYTQCQPTHSVSNTLNSEDEHLSLFSALTHTHTYAHTHTHILTNL